MLFAPIKPMLVSMGKEITDDEQSMFDIKWDGWRILIHKDGSKIMAFTRRGNIVTSRFPELKDVSRHIKVNTAILDCEGVVIRNGVSNFEDFTYRGKLNNPARIERAVITHPVTFVAFDILATDVPLTNKPLSFRRKLLKSIIEPSDMLTVTPYVVGSGRYLFDFTREKGMEGIVEKGIQSIYEHKRSNTWKKYKHFKVMEVTILGYKENPFALVVGRADNTGVFRTMASIEFGFKQDEKEVFRSIARQICRGKDRGVIWVEPLIKCKVKYLERTERGQLRITSFGGFTFND